MVKIRFRIALICVLCLFVSACTLSTSNETGNLNIIQTAIVATMNAQSTVDAEREVLVDATSSATTVFYSTPVYTNTPVPTVIPCNLVGFVMDVSIPDDELMEAGQIFTKTWRLQNQGTCAWTPAYLLVFMSGDRMNALAQSAFTSLVIEPGEMVDVSIQLTAPTIPGHYQGNFMLADSNGALFSFYNKAAFFVKISVPELIEAPDLTSTPDPNETPQASATPGENVSLESLSIVPSQVSTIYNEIIQSKFDFGDLSSNEGAIAFAQFDLSQIPAGATIESLSLQNPNYTISGNPFGSLSCARVYIGYFYPLSGEDYNFTTLGASGRACGASELNNLALNPDVLTSFLASGTSAIDIKVMFNELQTNNDGVGDIVRSISSDLRLFVSYYP